MQRNRAVKTGNSFSSQQLHSVTPLSTEPSASLHHSKERKRKERTHSPHFPSILLDKDLASIDDEQQFGGSGRHDSCSGRFSLWFTLIWELGERCCMAGKTKAFFVTDKVRCAWRRREWRFKPEWHEEALEGDKALLLTCGNEKQMSRNNNFHRAELKHWYDCNVCQARRREKKNMFYCLSNPFKHYRLFSAALFKSHFSREDERVCWKRRKFVEVFEHTSALMFTSRRE